jgi:hypothetical protein
LIIASRQVIEGFVVQVSRTGFQRPQSSGVYSIRLGLIGVLPSAFGDGEKERRTLSFPGSKPKAAPFFNTKSGTIASPILIPFLRYEGAVMGVYFEQFPLIFLFDPTASVGDTDHDHPFVFPTPSSIFTVMVPSGLLNFRALLRRLRNTLLIMSLWRSTHWIPGLPASRLPVSFGHLFKDSRTLLVSSTISDG